MLRLLTRRLHPRVAHASIPSTHALALSAIAHVPAATRANRQANQSRLHKQQNRLPMARASASAKTSLTVSVRVMSRSVVADQAHAPASLAPTIPLLSKVIVARLLAACRC
ncbi:uncharacterized protein L969DRAFT_95676 [Mixia osmundae IAM 14324]|uniref:Uncharacterized protein n=1 Tax=Mixia osmundae (strain CBS 9802 / IAM 14324 / JCM 22182 / KY 12970) TaxID=764103 RepID=G7EAA1_MIXOS|nr:uncharacterized protein L969DRAFT_95676 [Mixia osmundae IAM 14324]KEI37820.1 hypothetical protein L969DRAFT_95676 [Mixia osmundae IAM 14324]GAA99761.1 hypothetical protein E5Q_06464 [Mixia osmundae IAM 14324]